MANPTFVTIELDNWSGSSKVKFWLLLDKISYIIEYPDRSEVWIEGRSIPVVFRGDDHDELLRIIESHVK